MEITGVDPNYKPLFRKYDYGCEMAWKLQAIGIQLNEIQVQKLDAIHATGKQIKAALQYMTPQKLINYFHRQSRDLMDQDGTSINLYVDYIEMTERLNEHLEQKIDLTATIHRFPRNIKTAHDAVAAELKALINREKDNILKQMAEKYRREIQFAYRGLAVVFPSCAEDFVQEGTCLHHCVGSHPVYIEKQAEGKYLTVFIRKERALETPYYTATFYLNNDGIKLKECHGLHNKSAPDTVKAFLERYEEHLNKKMKKQQEAA